MNIYRVDFDWQFASENFEYGLIKADTLEKATKKAKNMYPDARVYVYELEFNEKDYCVIYKLYKG